MPVFDRYARYYNLLNADKDYAAECRYVEGLLREASPAIGTLLELGSGTARHARHLAETGIRVCGVERSASMLAAAQASLAAAPAELRQRIELVAGDARSVRLGRRFDAVISLFHVVSYQVRNEDLAAMFGTARAHLDSGGTFLFDYWHGPGVLTDPPAVRVRTGEDAELRVERTARPELLSRENVVKVHFSVTATDKATGQRDQLEEVHPMRYLFEPELELLLAAAGFRVRRTLAWLTADAPSTGSWLACTIAEAR